MRKPTRREMIVAAAAIIVVLLLLWLHGCVTDNDGAAGRGEATGSGSAKAPAAFTVTGDLQRAISPGDLVPLDLTLQNPNGTAIAIDQLRVTLGRVDAPNAGPGHPCTTADFEVRPLSVGVTLTLSGGGTATLEDLGVAERDWPAVGMVNRPVNQDGCKGASLTLHYEASGTEVAR